MYPPNSGTVRAVCTISSRKEFHTVPAYLNDSQHCTTDQPIENLDWKDYKESLPDVHLWLFQLAGMLLFLSLSGLLKRH